MHPFNFGTIGVIVKRPSLLDISAYAFGICAPLSTLKRIPMLSEILSIPIFVLWLIGYSTWYLGSLFKSNQNPSKANGWYGFVEFQQQYQTAALLGLIATVLGFFLPTLIAPIAWLYAIANVFWSIGNYHETALPHPDNPTYSTEKQKKYTFFSMGITTLSLIAAVSATILTFFPLAAPITLPILQIITAAVTLITATLFLYYFFSKSKLDSEVIIADKDSPASSINRFTNTPAEPTCFNHPCFQERKSTDVEQSNGLTPKFK